VTTLKERLALSLRGTWLYIKAYATTLWREAKDRKNPYWPPAWLRIAGAILGAAFLVFTMVDVIAAVVARVGSNLFDNMIATDLARVVISPVREYLIEHSTGLPFTGRQLYVIWAFSGLLFFCLGAFTHSRGAYAGWMVFGVVTVAMVWARTSAPAEWTAAGIAALTWSVLSVPVFSRLTSLSRSEKPYRRRIGSRAAEARGVAIQRHADARARQLGFTGGLGDYFSADEKRSVKLIAEQLKLPRARAKRLRDDYLPEAGQRSRGASPEFKRAIAKEYLAGGITQAELGRKHGYHESTISGWIREYKAMVNTPPDSPEPTESSVVNQDD
jgi:hypothetical protein